MCITILLSVIGGSTAAASDSSMVTLKYYDDRMDVSGISVEITDPGVPTSHKVGYGVSPDAKDQAVLTLKNDTLTATGVGCAKIKLNGIEYSVTIEPAPISIFLLMGQSNMEGSDGNAQQSVANTDGQVYATYGDRTQLHASNAGDFVPSALTGEYSNVNTNGTTNCISSYPVNMLCQSGNGKQGIDSGLAYEWNQRTGKKVWVVNVASGGSTQDSWSPGNENYLRAVSTMKAVYKTLAAEIAAGHYTLDHLGYFWCQGESDASRTAEHYANTFINMHESFKADLAFDHDSDPSTEKRTLEFADLVMIRAATNVGGAGYRQGEYGATSLEQAQSYQDLQMTGPRVAFYWMAANKELTDINIVSNITEKWVTMPDGTDGVADYFKDCYDGGKVDYPVQTEQASYWYSPKLPADVHPTVHYVQIGYNEIGRDAAKNACILIGETEPDSLSASVDLLSWDGYTEFDTSAIPDTVGSKSLAVAVADPVYCAKNINITLSDGLTYDHFDLTGSGTVELSCTPVVNTPDRYLWEYSEGELKSVDGEGYTVNSLTRLNGTTAEDGTFSSTQYKMSRNVALLHNRAWSVEWKAQGGEYMLFVSKSKASSEGAVYLQISKANNGISMGERTNVYDGCGVDLDNCSVSVADVHVYRIVNVPFENGENRLDLYVDGSLAGSLSEHCKGGAWDGASSDMLVGRDFLFEYIGAAPYTLRNCKIEYIEVNEGISEDEAEVPAIVGDVDGDGEVTMLDLFRLKLFIKQKDVPTDAEVKAADIDGDGEITMVDSFELKYRISTGYWRQ